MRACVRVCVRVCAREREREKQKLMYMYTFPRVVANYVSMRFECGRTTEAGIGHLYWLFGSRHTVCSAFFGQKRHNKTGKLEENNACRF